MNNHLKSILKVCGIVGLICLVTVLSCLPFVNFDNNKAELHADTIISNYEFQTSNYIVTASLYNYNVTAPQSSGFTLKNFSLYFNFTNVGYFISGNSLGDGTYYSFGMSSDMNSIVYDTWTTSYLNSTSNQPHVIFDFYLDSGFNNNIYSFFVRTQLWGGTNTSIAQTVFNFTDSNGKHFIVGFFGNFNATLTNANYENLIANNIFPYSDRTYYSNVTLTDNQNYTQGYSTGLQEGQQAGYEQGYRLGSEDGFVDGYRQGYDNGLNEQDVYTFGNLLTAVIDAPVGVFISMLDFNIMGFNLLNLVVGLLTLAVICLVIKLMLGGK